MGGTRVPTGSAVEAAERAREVSVRTGAALRPVADESLARRTGSLVTPAELAEMSGEPVAEVAVASYRFDAGIGRVPPPVSMTVRCLPADLDGVCRSVAKLLESRGWSSTKGVRTERVPARELGGFAAASERKGEVG